MRIEIAPTVCPACGSGFYHRELYDSFPYYIEFICGTEWNTSGFRRVCAAGWKAAVAARAQVAALEAALRELAASHPHRGLAVVGCPSCEMLARADAALALGRPLVPEQAAGAAAVDVASGEPD